MFERILVPVDFDDLTPTVLDHAIGLARLSKGRCHLLHAIEPVGDADDAETRAFYAGLERRASGLVEDLASRCADAHVPCETSVRVGRRGREIVETAERWDADLIVIGSRALLQDGRPHLGSTSHQVFFAARCPVLAVRAPDPA